MAVRLFMPEEVEFRVEYEQDDMSVRGNAMASGNEEHDKAAEDWVLSQLENGNTWAWAIVRVYARWAGFEGVDTLCAVSYKSMENFLGTDGEKADDYYEDMVGEAIADLLQQIARGGWDVAVPLGSLHRARRYGIKKAREAVYYFER